MEPVDSFGALGARIDDEWERADHADEALPPIATRALAEAQLHERVKPSDLLRWAALSPSLPQQEDLRGGFGELPLTLHHGRRTFVQALFWWNGTTTIHRHGFSGAFTVLDGSSLHTRYRFAAERRVNARMAVGRLELVDAKVLRPGEAYPIDPTLTHSLFHLDAPTVSIVVRSYGDPHAGPQYDYYPPSLEIDRFFQTSQRDPVLTRRLQTLKLALKASPAEFSSLALECIARSDLHAGWLVVEQAAQSASEAARVEPLLAALRARHGTVVDALAPVLAESQRRRKVVALRARARDPEQRFFLALLLNQPNRASILALVKARFPDGDAAERVLGWARSLAALDARGLPLDDAAHRDALAALLAGTPADAERTATLRASLLAPLLA